MIAFYMVLPNFVWSFGCFEHINAADVCFGESLKWKTNMNNVRSNFRLETHCVRVHFHLRKTQWIDQMNNKATKLKEKQQKSETIKDADWNKLQLCSARSTLSRLKSLIDVKGKFSQVLLIHRKNANESYGRIESGMCGKRTLIKIRKQKQILAAFGVNIEEKITIKARREEKKAPNKRKKCVQKYHSSKNKSVSNKNTLQNDET